MQFPENFLFNYESRESRTKSYIVLRIMSLKLSTLAILHPTHIWSGCTEGPCSRTSRASDAVDVVLVRFHRAVTLLPPVNRARTGESAELDSKSLAPGAPLSLTFELQQPWRNSTRAAKVSYASYYRPIGFVTIATRRSARERGHVVSEYYTLF